MTVSGGGDWNDPRHFIEPILPELLEDPVGSLTDGERRCGPNWLGRFFTKIAKRGANSPPHLPALNRMVMRVEIDPASAKAFMATPLNVERNGMPLTMGSALVALDIDPWSFAGELAIASRKDAVTRLEAQLRKIREGVPEVETIARKAIAGLPPPLVEGADLVTIMRLASRDPELVGALLCFLAVAALAILQLLSMITRSLCPVVVGYGLVGLTWISLSPRRDKVLRVLLVVASGVTGLILGIAGGRI